MSRHVRSLQMDMIVFEEFSDHLVVKGTLRLLQRISFEPMMESRTLDS